MRMPPDGPRLAGLPVPLRNFISSCHPAPPASQHCKLCFFAAAAAAGVLGIAALIDIGAHPSKDPTQDQSVGHKMDPKEIMSAIHLNMKDASEVPGILRLRGARLPAGMELPPSMIGSELPDMPELPEMPEFPEIPGLPAMQEPPDMPKNLKVFELPEMHELGQVLNFSESPGGNISSILALARDANSAIQGLINKVKADVLETVSSMGWNMDLAPFRALTYCREGLDGLIDIVQVQVADSRRLQLTISRYDSPVLLSVEEVLAGDRSCMGKPVVRDATKEIQGFADDVKAKVPAILRTIGWSNFDIEPFKAISYCSQGSHLIVRLDMNGCQSMPDMDLQLWLHTQPSSFGNSTSTIISGAQMVKSNDESCVGAFVEPLTGLP